MEMGHAGLGPAVLMIDDCVVEQAALSKCWPMAKVFLCTFHFLQRHWTWLYDGKNRILKEDRVVLIQHIRSMVYSKTEEELGSNHSSLISLEIARKYPHFLNNINAQWEKRTFWAHCYRKTVITRGNHTNNYAEAGIQILKDLVFARVKAYNLVQMFCFIVETMELHYKRNLLNIANNRVESYVAV